ncbi:Gfo/Idh/MocA family oxidoreductase [Parageobacillus sp. VR-IP]|uniref:Gfo/Idh/MocA family protein n=1 Tax=Parageobacillus sp. VR-IP TaxID=2742205 RepID=UPI001582F5BF|nr:Gfo/Idh/MocA family oxidoreductase [Parageobacillus sp. VR-IP]NUK30274.1 Gfo/Idh/MocA family oxidoreductase [Parageobacillus sp. VR-IP]
MRKVKVGIIGCGNISGTYLKSAKRFDSLEVVACADIDIEKAQKKAEEYNVPKACTVEELLADEEIEIVVNLTVPKAHAEVCLQALNAGKHIYVEKPLAITREEGKKILELARKKGLRVGAAPDTFLGGGIQTCRKLIDDGWIGKPVAATAFMMNHGHESWHPNPEFYYDVGGGPLFDMGPYYLTTLINLIGPVKRVTGSARITFPERTITSKPKYGKKVQVNTPTHVAGVIDFENGAIATMITSFDVWGAKLPHMEIYGSEGSIIVPNPNEFGGPVYVRRADDKDWREVSLTHGYIDNCRGLGVADMANAILTDRPHRANGEMAYHVLDIMQGLLEASAKEKHYYVTSTCQKPDPLPCIANWN